MSDSIELNTEIARKVFRHVVLMEEDEIFVLNKDTKEKSLLPPYSTDVKTAHEIISKLKSFGAMFNVKSEVENGELLWIVEIKHSNVPGVVFRMTEAELPLAICKVTLQFLNVVELVD